VDAFTKYLQLVPLKSLSGAETLQVFKERLTLFGRPRVVVVDRGTNFTYGPLQQYFRKQKVELHFIATGVPRANGQVERDVATVTNLLTTETEKLTEWPSKLSKIQESLNTTKQSSTGFSPSRLLFGIERSAGNAVQVESELPDIREKIDINYDREIAAKRLSINAENRMIGSIGVEGRILSIRKVIQFSLDLL
jgi:Integrase core domain.